MAMRRRWPRRVVPHERSCPGKQPEDDRGQIHGRQYRSGFSPEDKNAGSGFGGFRASAWEQVGNPCFGASGNKGGNPTGVAIGKRTQVRVPRGEGSGGTQWRMRAQGDPSNCLSGVASAVARHGGEYGEKFLATAMATLVREVGCERASVLRACGLQGDADAAAGLLVNQPVKRMRASQNSIRAMIRKLGMNSRMTGRTCWMNSGKNCS
jgi:hypothetical protein